MTIHKFIFSDVDGVLAGKQFLCGPDGKAYKVFSCGDKEGLAYLSNVLGYKIIFMSSDKEGFEISKKRIVDHLGYELVLAPAGKERAKYISECVATELSKSSDNEIAEIIYVGDSESDCDVVWESKQGKNFAITYTFAPADASFKFKYNAHSILDVKSAEGVFDNIAWKIQNRSKI